MIRLFLIILLILLSWWLLRLFLTTPPEKLKKYSQKIMLWIGVVVILLLILMGKLNGLFTLLGLVIATIIRLFNVLPQCYQLWLKATHQQQPNTVLGDKMTRDQAYKILGLKPDASDEDIIAAHRKLMQKIHPDCGGSAYLAAEINIAKDILRPLHKTTCQM